MDDEPVSGGSIEFYERSSQNDEFFEIHDFSTASDWEKLIDEIEETIHNWTHQFSQSKQEFQQDNYYTQCKDLFYLGKKYELVYHNCDTNSIDPYGDEEPDDEDDFIGKVEKVLLNDENDFPVSSHHLNQWFGVDEFLIVSINRSNSKQNYTIQEQQNNERNSRTMSMSEAKILQSAMVIALHNTPLRRFGRGGSYSMPVFVTVGRANDCEYVGRWQHGSTVVKFRCEVVLNQQTAIPPLYTKVSGLLDLFCLLMGKHLALRDLISRIRLYARYTYVVDGEPLLGRPLRRLEEQQKGGVPFGCLDPNDPPIESYHILPRFQNDMQNIESMLIEQLDPQDAEIWQIFCIKNPNPSCKLLTQLRYFTQNMYINAIKEISTLGSGTREDIEDKKFINTDGSLYGKVFNTNRSRAAPIKDTIEDEFRLKAIQTAIYDIFNEEEEDNDMSYEKGLPKSCPSGSLLSRFCRQSMQLEEWEEVRQLWRLFVKVLFQYWDEANTYESSQSIHSTSGRRWFIPHTDDNIEWTSCLLEQKINMLNLCCLAHIDNVKQKRDKREKDELDEAMKAWIASDNDVHHLSSSEEFSDDDSFFEVETENGKLKTESSNVVARGVLCEMKLDDGRIINVPITQQVPPKTEDMITEQQQMLSSLDAEERAYYQSAPLKSDMEAFKAANPNSSFYDFLSWYSPKDVVPEGMQLSKRMQEDHNLWKEIWNNAKAVPVSEQKPLFDYRREAEIVLHYFETLDIGNYMNQVLVCTFVSAYYDMARWWNKYIDTYHINIHIIDVALQDIKKALSQTLSHPVMLLEPLMDLCQKFRDVELLISEAVCHIETFKQGLSCNEVQDMIDKLLTSNTGDVTLYSDKNPLIKDMLLKFITKDPDAREYRFRCMAPRPYLFSKYTAQSMYVLYSSREFRICTALSEQVPL